MQENWHDKSPLKKCGCQQKCPLKKCGCPQKYHAPLESLESLESRNSRTHRARRPDIGIRAFSVFYLIFSAARKVVLTNRLHLCLRSSILYMCLKAHWQRQRAGTFAGRVPALFYIFRRAESRTYEALAFMPQAWYIVRVLKSTRHHTSLFFIAFSLSFLIPAWQGFLHSPALLSKAHRNMQRAETS